MQGSDDIRLLRQYLEAGREEAFTTLVNRHVHMVYSVALRHTGNPDAAQEITQAVFVILARKARTLSSRVVIAGWLYNTVRMTAITFNRANLRRARREEQSLMPTDSTAPEDAKLWVEIAPMLDAAMAALNRADRDAIILRFFENRSIREVGNVLGANEEAAKKRISRALDKLRIYFAKRGVNSTTAVIAGTMAANSVQAAPTAVVTIVGASAVGKGAALGASTSTLIDGTVKLMTWTKLKFATFAIMGVLVVAAGGAIAVRSVFAGSSDAPPDTLWQAYADALAQSTNGADALIRVGSIMEAHPPMAAIRINKIRPRLGGISGAGTSGHHVNLGMFLGEVVRYVNHLAPDFPQQRIVVPGELMNTRFDLLDTLPQGGPEVLHQALKEQFGLILHQETRPNLALTVRDVASGGLHAHTGDATGFRSSNVTMAQLARHMSRSLGVDVTNQTGLTGGYDYSLNLSYPFSGDELRNAVTNQLGLDLVPSGDGQQIEFWVVEKVKQ